MRNTLAKDHWLQEYNFRVALKDQTKNKQSRKFDNLSKDRKQLKQSSVAVKKHLHCLVDSHRKSKGVKTGHLLLIRILKTGQNYADRDVR